MTKDTNKENAIQTKYKLGDYVWIMLDNKPIKDRIERIQTWTSWEGVTGTEYLATTITYYLYKQPKTGIKEQDCFATKEDLINSL